MSDPRLIGASTMGAIAYRAMCKPAKLAGLYPRLTVKAPGSS